MVISCTRGFQSISLPPRLAFTFRQARLVHRGAPVSIDGELSIGRKRFFADALTVGIADSTVVLAADIARPFDDFHVYAVEWRESRLDFYCDDVRYFSYAKDDRYPAYWRFDRPFYLLLNLAIGGTWGGAQGIDDSIFPLRYEIDYVRYYRWD